MRKQILPWKRVILDNPGLSCYGRHSRKLSSSRQCRKEVKISESISVRAEFIGDVFSRNSTGLAQVGEKGKSKGDKSKRARERSFVLRTYNSWWEGG